LTKIFENRNFKNLINAYLDDLLQGLILFFLVIVLGGKIWREKAPYNESYS